MSNFAKNGALIFLNKNYNQKLHVIFKIFSTQTHMNNLVYIILTFNIYLYKIKNSLLSMQIKGKKKSDIGY